MAGTTKQSDLCYGAKKLYAETKLLQKKSQRIKKQNIILKNRLKLAENFAKRKDFQHFSKYLNASTIKFFESQVRCQKRKPKGRRYDVNDKVLALSLYKTSPKGYRFLSTLFALPSRKTLSGLLNKVPFHPGINPHIIENLKCQVRNLKEVDKTCVLLFDEMALEPGLTYDKKHDIIFGFENYDKETTSAQFSDHVLVFMLRGINKKWKQPIAYYFCNGTTKTDRLVLYLKQVISNIFTTGLKVVATVCDQGATNVAAINKLKEETNNYCMRQQIENRYFGFLIEDVEIVPVFDPPHLLKCVRNNLMTKDVTFIYRGENHRASWRHIKTLYEFDKNNEVNGLRSLPSLRDEHIYPEKMHKMKVKLAAQVFSQRVASILRLLVNYSKKSVHCIT